MSSMELPEEEHEQTPEGRPPDAPEPSFLSAPDAVPAAPEGGVEPVDFGEPGADLPPVTGEPSDEIDSTVDALLSMSPEQAGADPSAQPQVPSWAQTDAPAVSSQPEFAPVEPEDAHVPTESQFDAIAHDPAAHDPAAPEPGSDSREPDSAPVAPTWTDGSASVDDPVEATGTSDGADMFDVPLGTLVYRFGLLTAEQIEAALEQSEQLGKRLGDVLIDSGMIAEHDLSRLLAGQKGLPFLDLSATEIDPEAAALLLPSSARIYCALPIRVEDGAPVVAVSDPTNGLVVEGVRRALGGDLTFAVATRSDLQRQIAAIYGPEDEPVADSTELAVSDEVAVEPLGPEPELSAPKAGLDGVAHPPAAHLPSTGEPEQAEPMPPLEPLTIAAPGPDPAPEPIHEPPPAAELGAPVANLEAAADLHAGVAPPSSVLGRHGATTLSDHAHAIRVVIRLAGGETIDAGEYVDPTEAGVRARELVASIDRAEPGQWPFFAGRFIRPDSILTVDLIDKHPRY